MQDKEHVVSISLPQASLKEVTLFGLLSRGMVAHSAGFILKTEASSSREESPRAVTEVRDNGLDTKQESGITATEVILAAEDAEDHVQWRRKY